MYIQGEICFIIHELVFPDRVPSKVSCAEANISREVAAFRHQRPKQIPGDGGRHRNQGISGEANGEDGRDEDGAML